MKKYYEIRVNSVKGKLKICPLSKIIETEINILEALPIDAYGFSFTEYKGFDSLSNLNLAELGITQDYYDDNENFNWVINNSSHRKDVRIVNEETYNMIVNDEMLCDIMLCKKIDHIFTKHTESYDSFYIHVDIASHKLGDVSRIGGSYAIVSEGDADFYYGKWVTSYGLIDVQFPKTQAVVVDETEVFNYYRK